MPKVAKLAGVHEDTLYLWKKRYKENGLDGLLDESKAPLSHPNEYSEEVKQKIIALRNEALEKERRYIGPEIIKLRLAKKFGVHISASGIGKFLNRAGLIPEERKRRVPKKEKD